MLVKHSTYIRAKNTIINLRDRVMTISIEKNKLISELSSSNMENMKLKTENDNNLTKISSIIKEKESFLVLNTILKSNEASANKEQKYLIAKIRKLEETHEDMVDEREQMLETQTNMEKIIAEMHIQHSLLNKKISDITLSDTLMITDELKTTFETMKTLNNQNLHQKLAKDRRKMHRKNINKIKKDVIGFFNIKH